METPIQPVTLVATLGGQPQIITFALDALLDRGVPVAELILLHLNPDTGIQTSSVSRSLQKLSTLFKNGRYQDRPLRFSTHTIQSGNQPLDDIRNEVNANAAWNSLNELIGRLKHEHRTLHICISGGRRIVSLLTMSAAMIHFGHQDMLWHMYTPEEWQQKARDGRVMHLSEDAGFRMIEVPMLPWGTYFPALRQLGQPVTSQDVLARARRFMDESEIAQCQSVMDQLSNRQKDVLIALAQHLNPQQCAEKLHISIRTVDSHKTVILDVCRNVWNIPKKQWLDYHFIANKFEHYIQNKHHR